MEQFQNTVESFLRAQPALFLNMDYQLSLGGSAAAQSNNIEFVAVDFVSKTVWLVAGGRQNTVEDVLKTLRGWQLNWPLIQMDLWRDCKIPVGFEIRPWAFVEQAQTALFAATFVQADVDGHMPSPRVTAVEELAKLAPHYRRRDDINGLQFAA